METKILICPHPCWIITQLVNPTRRGGAEFSSPFWDAQAWTSLPLNPGKR